MRKYILFFLFFAMVMAGCSKNKDGNGQTVNPTTKFEKYSPTSSIKFTLSARNLPLSQVLDRMRSESHRKINLAHDSQEYASAKISVELHETPFWEAIAKVAQQAGLGLEVRPMEEILLTKTRTTPQNYLLLGHGLLVLDTPITLQDCSGTKLPGFGLTLYCDPHEMAYVRFCNASIITKASKLFALSFESTNTQKQWEIEWVAGITQMSNSPAISLKGAIEADCREKFLKLVMLPQRGATAISNDLHIAITKCESKGKSLHVSFVVKWNNGLTPQERKQLSYIREKAGRGDKSTEQEEKLAKDLSKKAKNIHVVDVEPLDSEGRIKIPCGFNANSNFGAGRIELKAIMPVTISEGGRIQVIVAEDKIRQKMHFLFKDMIK